MSANCRLPATDPYAPCGGLDHVRRRTLLRGAGLAAMSWLTPVARVLAEQEEHGPRGRRPRSVIMLWLAGGPSQLETFDPHPGGKIGGEVRAIATRAPGIEIADTLPQTAERFDVLSVVRNVVSREGDHERATYNVRTGYRPDPTLTHPGLGAILCHQLSAAGAEIPRHVSIFPGPWPSRGGYLGDQYDAFKTFDPLQPLPDVTRRIAEPRFQSRLADLEVVEQAFARGRLPDLDARRTLHRSTIDSAVRMMTSEQLRAFDVTQEPERVRTAFGETPFGRGCLAAARLIEAGVRCVEVSLGGWDTHAANHSGHVQLCGVLDPALAALLDYLRDRDQLGDTIVVIGGEFGRTPNINPLAGRDHWPHGFSIALAGGGLRGGVAVGETDPAGSKIAHPVGSRREPGQGTPIECLHATVLAALGIDYRQEIVTPIGRPMALSQGEPIAELLATAGG